MKSCYLLVLIMMINVSLKAQNIMSNQSPLVPSLRDGDLLFISGQVGIDPETSKLSNATFENELKQVLANIHNQLNAHGLGFSDLVSITIYLKDMQHYEATNKIYTGYFDKQFPTRTCIAVAGLPLNARVEISGIATFRKKEKSK